VTFAVLQSKRLESFFSFSRTGIETGSYLAMAIFLRSSSKELYNRRLWWQYNQTMSRFTLLILSLTLTISAFAQSPDSLKGHLSFLASDALEGRGTPSRGLNIAAEYIAAHFRRMGLEPLGGDKDNPYFQVTTIKPRGASADGTPERVQNVVGILRGSDPKLRDTAIIITAHYDHLGIRPKREGDAEGMDYIYNGANDDGSGTVGVLELAEMLSKSKTRPKRSIIFITFFGEERGLLGSRYYGEHPLFPIEKTIADINLEQIGRTDDTEGPRVGAACMTGFDFSDVGEIFAKAGKSVGVAVTKHPQYSDAFFARSDNQALADLGVPAHTICTAFEFPDYHKATDHWEKIDYANMAKILKMVEGGVLSIANNANSEPRWNEQNTKTKRYVDAWKAKHAK
jgi:Zn-dependent M28 family amino/carboxypeptidase